MKINEKHAQRYDIIQKNQVKVCSRGLVKKTRGELELGTVMSLS